MNLKKKYIVNTSIALVLATIFVSPTFVGRYFGHMDFMQVLFLIMSPAQGGTIELSMVLRYIKIALPLYIVVIAFFMFSYYLSKNGYVYHTRFINKGKKYYLKLKNPKKLGRIMITLVLVVTLVRFDRQLGIINHIVRANRNTYIYEQHYVDPMKADLKWPDKKRNLIILNLESMEYGFNDIKVDGQVEHLIPNLEKIANQNISFSHNKNFGGAQSITGTGWTVASLVAQATGTPIQFTKLNVTYGEGDGFLPGVNSLGQLLQEQGYQNYFMAGSDANFGGREEFYRTHGDYIIRDTKYYKEIGKIPEDYNVFWGFEDEKLFEYAKEELLYISKQEEPFNFTMLTVDTHFTDGYTDPSCLLEYETPYANAIKCSDGKVAEFLSWIQEQDFYDNTTIMITGDHLTMNYDFSKGVVADDRGIYNAFINSDFKSFDETRTKEREFSIIDHFPTTLASLGVEIKGERLGLGTNLMSDKKTLLEEMGYDKLNEEISKNSKYYNDVFIQTKSKKD